MAGWCIGAIMKPIPASCQAAFHHLGADHHVQAHLGQRIGRTRFRRQVAVAMLGHDHARTRHDKGRRGRDVQRALAVAAGADDIHRALRARAPALHLARITEAAAAYSSTVSPRVRSAIRKPPIWAGVPLAIEQRAEGRFSLGPGQGAGGGNADQGLQDIAHAGTRASAISRKLRSIWWPCSEAMRFRVELHAFDRQGLVAQAHDGAIVQPGRHLQTVGQGGAIDDQANDSGWPETGEGRPANMPLPAWCMVPILPCTISWQRTTLPPKACPMV